MNLWLPENHGSSSLSALLFSPSALSAYSPPQADAPVAHARDTLNPFLLSLSALSAYSARDTLLFSLLSAISAYSARDILLFSSPKGNLQ